MTGLCPPPRIKKKNEEEDNPIWSVDRFVPSSYQLDVFLGELELDSPVYGKTLPFCSLVHNGIHAECLYRIPFSSAPSSTLPQT